MFATGELDQFGLTTYRHSYYCKKTNGIVKSISLFSFSLRPTSSYTNLKYVYLELGIPELEIITV
jgi:hypothetical protein